MNIGDRVGAIESGNKDQVRLFGYGIYQGDLPRPDRIPGIFGTAAQLREAAEEVKGKPYSKFTPEEREAVDRLLNNPCILLDSGDKVWGCQCWWGPEDKIRKTIGNREVVIVPVPEANKDLAE